MSLDNSIVRKICGTVIPLEGSVCVCVGGGEGTLTIIFLVTYARHQQLLFSLKIYRVYPGAFLMHFYKVRTLDWIWGLSPLYGVRGEACGKIVLGHSKELK